MNTLFIDTHSEVIRVALKVSDKLYIKEQISEHSHAVYLMNMIKSIIEENKLTIHDINSILVVNGPGSFTGLRIGLSNAKTLAYSLNIPIKVISSLTCYLVSSDITDNKMAVIEDNKGYYISVFDSNNECVIDETYEEDISNYNYKIVDNKMNIDKIIEYSLKLESINPHLVRANYVKLIEVEK